MDATGSKVLDLCGGMIVTQFGWNSFLQLNFSIGFCYLFNKEVGDLHFDKLNHIDHMEVVIVMMIELRGVCSIDDHL